MILSPLKANIIIQREECPRIKVVEAQAEEREELAREKEGKVCIAVIW